MTWRARRKTRDKGCKSNLGGKKGEMGKERKSKNGGGAKMKKLREGNEEKPCTVDS